MINTNLKTTGLGNCGISLPVCHKKSPIGTKKLVLREMQNDSRSLTRNDPVSCVRGGFSADAVKVSGTERLAPECPLNSGDHQSWRSNGANKHVTHAGRNFASELGKRRVQEASNKKSNFLKLRKYFHNQPELPQHCPEDKARNTSSVPASAPTPTASLITLSPDRSPVPISRKKPGNGLPAAELNRLQLTSESEVPTASLITLPPERSSVPISREKPGNCLPVAESNCLHLTSESEVPTTSLTMLSPDRSSVPISHEKPLNGLPAAESNRLHLTSESEVPTTSLTTLFPDRSSVPISHEKPGGLPAAESNRLQLTSESEVHHSADSKGSTDQERKEQFLHLQKLQKNCYEYDQKDYIHLFCNLSPVELSRCAVELEKRSIQLSVEEGKEITRMMTLNIFGKSSPTKNPLPIFRPVQTKK